VVERDYRLRLSGEGLGRSYEQVDEDVEVARHSASDPENEDTYGRGLRAHRRTQNAATRSPSRAEHS
jgi:hypothetical protein